MRLFIDSRQVALRTRGPRSRGWMDAEPDKLIQRSGKRFNAVASVVLIVLMLLFVGDVLFRLLGRPITGSDDTGMIGAVKSGYLPSGEVINDQQHYSLEPLFAIIIRPFERFFLQTTVLARPCPGARGERGVTVSGSKNCP